MCKCIDHGHGVNRPCPLSVDVDIIAPLPIKKIGGSSIFEWVLYNCYCT